MRERIFRDVETGELRTLEEERELYLDFAATDFDEQWAVDTFGSDAAFHGHMEDALTRFHTVEMV